MIKTYYPDWYEETMCRADGGEWVTLEDHKKFVKILQSRLEELEKDAKKYARLPLVEWIEFEYWLDRCYVKGHLENCSDLIEPYRNLSNAFTAMQANSR